MKCLFLLNTTCQVLGGGDAWGSFVDRVLNVRSLTCGYKLHILVVFRTKCHSSHQGIFFTAAREEIIIKSVVM